MHLYLFTVHILSCVDEGDHVIENLHENLLAGDSYVLDLTKVKTLLLSFSTSCKVMGKTKLLSICFLSDTFNYLNYSDSDGDLNRLKIKFFYNM